MVSLDVVNGGEEEQVRPRAEQGADEEGHRNVVRRLQQQHDDLEFEQDEQPQQGALV